MAWSSVLLKLAAFLSAAAVAASPTYAGLEKGRVTVGSTIVYLGVVPATQTRDYSSEQVGDMAMGGASANSPNGIHLVVALFDHGTGQRITTAQVKARFIGERGRRWSTALKPMTMNRAMTYGAYSNMGGNNKASILIDVARRSAGRDQSMTARFEYNRD